MKVLITVVATFAVFVAAIGGNSAFAQTPTATTTATPTVTTTATATGTTSPGRMCEGCPPRTDSAPMPAGTGNAGLSRTTGTGIAVVVLGVIALGAVVGARRVTKR